MHFCSASLILDYITYVAVYFGTLIKAWVKKDWIIFE